MRRKSCARLVKWHLLSSLMLPALSWAPRKGWGNLLKFVFPETFFLSTWFQIPRERSSFKTQSGSFFRRASCRCSPTLWSGCVRAAMSRPGMLSWVEWCPLSSWWRGFLWSGCCRTSWPSSKLCSLSWWTSQERYKHFLMSLEIIDVWITYMNFCIPWWLSQVSNGAVAMAKTTLEQLLIRCATPLKDEEKTEELLSAQDKSFHLVTHDLVREVTSPNSTVRKQAMHSLQVLAQVTGKSVTIIMEPHKEVSVVFFWCDKKCGRTFFADPVRFLIALPTFFLAPLFKMIQLYFLKHVIARKKLLKFSLMYISFVFFSNKDFLF